MGNNLSPRRYSNKAMGRQNRDKALARIMGELGEIIKASPAVRSGRVEATALTGDLGPTLDRLSKYIVDLWDEAPARTVAAQQELSELTRVDWQKLTLEERWKYIFDALARGRL